MGGEIPRMAPPRVVGDHVRWTVDVHSGLVIEAVHLWAQAFWARVERITLA